MVGALEAAEAGVVGVDLVDFRVVAPKDWLGAPHLAVLPEKMPVPPQR